jgi:hypothetical protein
MGAPLDVRPHPDPLPEGAGERNQEGAARLAGERATGDAELVEDFELAPGAPGVVGAGQDAGVALDQGGGVLWRFTEQLDAEVGQAELLHPRDELGGRLGGGVVDGVAAADVGDERVARPGAVAQIDVVRVARPAAGAVVGAGAQRVAEDAVLLMESGINIGGTKLSAAESGGLFVRGR